jgi:arylsulfatase A
MKFKNYIILALSFCLFLKASAEVEEFEGLTYAKYGDRELQLDLFKLKEQTEPRPAIIWIHGGGWSKGTRKNGGKMARYIAEHNYVTVSISYRLSGEAPFPVQIQDCKAAVRWLRANAKQYGIDPDRIGAIGHSAGGHLAALLATSNDVPELEGEGGNPSFSSTIQAAVPMGAQSDMETERIRSMTAQPPPKAAIWHEFLGGSLDDNEAMYQLASPRRYLDANDPPMMFIAGALDNSDTLALPIREDMRRLKITEGILVIPGAPHHFTPEQRWFDLSMSTAVFFFDNHL